MSMNSSNTRGSLTAWQSISTIAAELSCDIREIYPQANLVRQSISIRSNAPAIYKQIDSCLGGDLVVLATGDSKAKEEFCHEVVHHVALRNNQPMAFFCLAVPYLRFARRLIGDLSEISPEASIYDGLLSDLELSRLATSLDRLGSSHIYLNPIRPISIDQLCEDAKGQCQTLAGMKLILVDYLQLVTASSSRPEISINGLVRLKELAQELHIPIVVLYQLEPIVGRPLSTVTRSELKEIGNLVGPIDRFLLLSRIANSFSLTVPKWLNNPKGGHI